MSDAKEKGKRWYKQTTSVVREVVHGWDPYGLLAGGCPEDEFDSEIASIVAQVARIRGEQDAVHCVSRVFSSAFEPGPFGVTDCQQVGTRLFQRLAEEGLLQ